VRSEEGGSVALFLGQGSSGRRQRAREAAAAAPRWASRGRRSGRLIGRARLSVRGRRWGKLGRKGREGDGPRLGRNRCSG
jgi:hypothetical protein